MTRQLIEHWRELEKAFHAKTLDWALNYIPKNLRVARSPEFPFGLDDSNKLPESYREFVKEVGYPSIGFQYYCQQAFTFLPPEHRQSLSGYLHVSDTFPLVEDVEDRQPKVAATFFAGWDLSDIHGYCFITYRDQLEVFSVYNTVIGEPCGTFEVWLSSEIERLHELIAGWNDSDVEKMKQDANDDPHRALDYALYDGIPDPDRPFSDDDLSLHWVEDQVDTPYLYGLVNDDCEWMIPMEKSFSYVAPFRSGEAIVRLGDDRYVIDRTGKRLRDEPVPPVVYGPDLLNAKGKTFASAGRLSMGDGNFRDHLKRIGGKLRKEMSDRTHFIVIGDCDYNPEALDRANELSDSFDDITLLTETEFIEKSGFKPQRY